MVASSTGAKPILKPSNQANKMKTYLVGGAVRDQLLNIPVYDNDWVVVGSTAEAMTQQGFQPVGKDFPVFLHPKTKEEYALARTERKSGHGYKGFDFYASPDVTLEEDLERRDLTINAMAMDDAQNIIDPFSGQQDLNDKLLRHVSSAFVEDPLRVLRVARFNARFAHLGFHVADETLALMQQLAAQGEIEHLTKERVWQELYRALGEQSPDVFFRVLFEAQALPVLMPEISEAFATQGITPCSSLLHTAGTLKTEAELRFAMLCYQAQLTADQLESLLPRINATKRCQRCCKLITQQLDTLIHFSQQPAEALLELYQQLEPQRRPEQLEWMKQAMSIVANDGSFSTFDTTKQDATIAAMDQLMTVADSIKPADLVSEGFQGKALGKELHQRQLKAIAQTFDAVTDTVTATAAATTTLQAGKDNV